VFPIRGSGKRSRYENLSLQFFPNGWTSAAGPKGSNDDHVDVPLRTKSSRFLIPPGEQSAWELFLACRDSFIFRSRPKKAILVVLVRMS
jgi:hypothetical protein